MNLDVLLSRRPQRRPDLVPGNLPDAPLPQAAVSAVGPGAPPPPVVEVTRQDGPPPIPTFATANVDLVQIKGEPQPSEEEAPPGPPLAQLLRPAPPPVVSEIGLPRGAHFLSAVREPAFSRTFPRYCAACRCRPAAPQLGRRLDYVDDPTFNAAWHEGPQPSMDELILIARSLCYVFIRLGYEGLQRGTGREIRLFCRQPFVRRLRAAHDQYVWLVDRAAVESRTCTEDDLELLMGYLRLIVETKRASGLNEALLE
jgi:hypothetical protein